MKNYCKTNELKNVCGDRIRKARLNYYSGGRRMTQDELAAKLQLCGSTFTRITVNRIEKGERHVSDFELIIIAEALKTDVMHLMFGDLSQKKVFENVVAEMSVMSSEKIS